MSKRKTENSNESQKPLFHLDHPRPISRRELLAQGFIGFSATLFLPSALSLLLERGARADVQGGCDMSAGGPAPGLIPFLVFDMAGGGAMPGNFLAGKQGGPEDLLASYDTLGWDPRENGALDKSFGIPMSAKYSKILQGIKQTASAEAQGKLQMGSLCNFSQDDSRGNPLSAITAVSKLGYKGQYIPTGLGMENGPGGGNSDVALAEATLKPLTVNSVSDVLDSISYGPAFRGLSANTLRALGTGTLKTSQEQMAKYAALDPSGQQLAQLADCAYQKNLGYTSGVSGMDPRQDALFQKIYNLNAGSQANSKDAVSAAVVMNALKGNSGPGAITISGCDYHDGTQTTGDGKDLETGQQIGRAVEAAFRLGKPLFFQLLTDGGISARQGTRNWSSDSGIRSMTVVGYMNPAATPHMLRQQVGYYTDAQGVERGTLVGSEPSKAAFAVFANYMNVIGKLGDFETVAPRGLFTADQLESVLLFG